MTGTFYGELEAAASARGSQPAFTFLAPDGTARTWSFGELFAAAGEIATRLRAQGLDDPTRPLGLLLRSQEEQTLHYLGALRAGAVPAILTPPNRKVDREYYARTMAEVLRRTSFRALVTDLDHLDLGVATYEPRTLRPTGGASGPAPAPEGEPLDASFLQFSSGTTGFKRGVLVRDEAVLAQLAAYRAALELTPDDRIVSWLPLSHDMGFVACLNLSLRYGVHTVVIDPIDWVTRPALLLQATSRFRATLSWNPNFAYAFLAQRARDRDLGGVDLSSLRGLVNCSEPVTHASQRQFLERFGPFGLRDDVFMGCYAMAETTFALTHGQASDPGYLDHVGPRDGARADDADPYVSVGRPIEGVELAVVNDGGSRRPDREIGELWVRSPFNLTGYFGHPEATAQAFAGDWYRTGDLGYRVGEEVFVTGRRKDVLIVGGVNVFPHDLEEIAGRVEGVVPGRTVAFARFDPRAQTERLTILAESDREGDAARQVALEIRRWIQASFDVASSEVHLVPPGWLIKSTSGKIARSANREKWLEQRAARTPSRQPIGASRGRSG